MNNKATHFKLDKKFFEEEGDIDNRPHYKTVTFIVDRFEFPAEGGIYVHHKGTKYPVKGFPFTEAIIGIDLVKKYLMSFIMSFSIKEIQLPLALFALLPWKKKLKVLERFGDRFIIFSDYALRYVYLKPKYYTKCAVELKTFISSFLISLGLSLKVSVGIAKAFATVIEYDDAYRYRIQDLFSEITKDELHRDPSYTIQKMLKILESREQDGTIVSRKFTAVIKLLKYAFYSRRVKSAFRVALDTVEFKNLQFDEGDKYYCLLREGYNFFGKNINERVWLWKDMHGGEEHCPPQIEITI